MKIRLLALLLLAYIGLLFVFTLYWGTHFSRITHIKGDGFSVYIAAVLGLTYLLFIAAQNLVKKLKLILLVILPIIDFIIAFVIGWITLTIMKIPETDKDLFASFSTIYAMVNTVAIIVFFSKPGSR